MITTTIALVVAILLCLAFDATTLIGVVGVVLLAYLNPTIFLSLSVLAVVVVVFIYFHKRSSRHGVPKLPDKRD